MIRPTRTCCWCEPPHLIEQGDEGAGVTHAMCPEAEAREWARMQSRSKSQTALLDTVRAQDMAILLVGGPEAWRDAPNVNRIAAYALAEDVLRRALAIGVWRA